MYPPTHLIHIHALTHARTHSLTYYRRAIDYLNMRNRIFVVDGYAGWDPK